jgi:sulfur-oxidizing protein SoxX
MKRLGGWLLLLGALTAPAVWAQAPEVLQPFAQPLTPQPGDPVRGRQLVVDRQKGFCLLCHSGPFPEERFQGTMAPDLSLAAGQRRWVDVRARLVNPTLFNPETIMPAYLSTRPGTRVNRQFEGKTLLQAQDIEDIAAFLMNMKP